MKERILTAHIICQFKEHLILEERSENTIEKYMRDIKAFVSFLPSAVLTKEVVIEYKKHFQEDYKIRYASNKFLKIVLV